MDVKSSFLHGELKEMFFMRIPQGLDAPKYLFFISETLFMALKKYLRPGFRNSIAQFLDLVSDSHLDHSLDGHPT